MAIPWPTFRRVSSLMKGDSNRRRQYFAGDFRRYRRRQNLKRRRLYAVRNALYQRYAERQQRRRRLREHQPDRQRQRRLAGENIAASGRTDGNAGVIFNTGLEDDGKLSAKVNGRIVQLSGKRNYLPLSPYSRYEVELQNSKTRSTATTLFAGVRAI